MDVLVVITNPSKLARFRDMLAGYRVRLIAFRLEGLSLR